MYRYTGDVESYKVRCVAFRVYPWEEIVERSSQSLIVNNIKTKP